MADRILDTKCFGIVVRINECGIGEIVSDLNDGVSRDAEREIGLVAAFDTVESMVLAHALAGIDILDPRYIEGIETAVEAVTNNI